MESGFSLSVSQNPYLSTDDDEMDAVLTVSTQGLVGGAAAPEVAQVIAIDCSGSMAYPHKKIAAAQRATSAAIDALRDGALFAVVEGTHGARVVYPTGPRLVAATPETRRAAKNAVRALKAGGGTRMGEWLGLARRLLSGHPTAVRHVILLTDGQNNPGDEKLDAELAAGSRMYTCDPRGVGADWDKRELLRIAEALHGTADAVRQPEDLVADFEAMTRTAMEKVIPEARLVVSTTLRSSVAFLRQTFPTEATLVGDPLAERKTAFATGSWGAETREFFLRLAVSSAGTVTLNHDVLLARVDLEVRKPGSTDFVRVGDGDPAVVVAQWTNDLKLSSVIDPKVAHVTRQTELGQAVMAGCDAHDAHDLDAAARHWGRAVALATSLNNEKVLGRLLRLVDVVGDPADGNVRIRAGLTAEELLYVGMSSVMSSMSPAVELPPVADDPAAAAVPELVCPKCGQRWEGRYKFCGACGEPLAG
ncbi:VWA domain-containing protein [Actinosynnema sp. NPDC059335]|uniref:VWA domain-containing protein n=1 Tax=Actinosynnema sp. NPDC059335 TaxID=3346804 RepID=UPI00366DF45B